METISKCKRCGKELSGFQKSYCCLRCGKLHLKAMYKRRKGISKSAYVPNLEYDKLPSAKTYKVDPSKYQSRRISQKYIREKKPCMVCGSMETQRHHEDYDKALSITWICQKHHSLYHLIKKIDPSLTIGDYGRGAERGVIIIKFPTG